MLPPDPLLEKSTEEGGMSAYRHSKQSRSDLQAMTEAFLAKGGTITKCEPGPSEEITLKNGRKQKPKAKEESSTRF